MWRFYENYAPRKMAMYVEKVVESLADVVETVDTMAGMFSLVAVGRGGQQPKELLVGLDEWAEARRELGIMAEILASNTSMEMGSVLIKQQHRVLVQVPQLPLQSRHTYFFWKRGATPASASERCIWPHLLKANRFNKGHVIHYKLVTKRLTKIGK
ncbi:hypothetical protein VPH35_073010 [Triticum aestivum]